MRKRLCTGWLLLALLPYLGLSLFSRLPHHHEAAPDDVAFYSAHARIAADRHSGQETDHCLVCQWHVVADACLLCVPASVPSLVCEVMSRATLAVVIASPLRHASSRAPPTPGAIV